MKRISRVFYQTLAEIEARIRECEDEALDLAPDTNEHRAIMKEIGELRMYAEAKRWAASPGLKPVVKL